MVPGILLTRKSSLIHATMPFSWPGRSRKARRFGSLTRLPRHLYYTTGTVDKKRCLFRPVRDSRDYIVNVLDLFRHDRIGCIENGIIEIGELVSSIFLFYITFLLCLKFSIRIFNSLYINVVNKRKSI